MSTETKANAGKVDQLKVDLSGAVVHVMAQKKDGENWLTMKENKFDPAQLPAEMATKVLLYGLSKLLQDRTSQLRSSGVVASLDGMQGYYDMLCKGQWASKRVAGAKAPAVDMVLAEVVAKAMKAPLSVVMDKLAAAGETVANDLKAKYAKEYAKAKDEADKAAADFSFDL